MKRFGWSKLDVNISGEPVTAMTRVGGYTYWDWNFPFIHRKPEQLYVVTKSGIYTMTYIREKEDV